MKRFWILSLAIALILGLSNSARADDNKVLIFKGDQDKFSKSISFPGKTVFSTKLFSHTDWEIRGWVNKVSLTPTYQLYVEFSYSGEWRFYQSAADDSATDLNVVQISRHVGSCGNTLFGCDLDETVGVDLSDAELRQKALTGFQIKITAKSGDAQILDISPAQIQSALLTVNQWVPEDRKWSAALSPAYVANISGFVKCRYDGGQNCDGYLPEEVAKVTGKGRFGLVLYAILPGSLDGIYHSAFTGGVIVARVEAGSISDKATISSGDIITSVNGKLVSSPQELAAMLGGVASGQTVEVSGWHRGAKFVTKVGPAP